MADNQEKKSFYALNLTEGRMFGVFIGIVLVLVAIFFTIMVTAFKLSKPKGNSIIKTENIEKKEIKNADSESSFSFYSDLVGEEAVKQDDILSKEVIKLNQSNTFSENKQENVPAVSQNVQVGEVSEQTEEPQLSIDNSEVLYSSHYQQNVKFKKDTQNPEVVKSQSQPSKTVAQNKQVEKKTPAVAEKTSTKPAETKKAETKNSVRYVVQVGSYTNKKIADEITQHYTKVGYPVYQQEFSKDGQIYYRLRVGPFKEKDRAENYLLSIKDSKYGKNSYISKIFI